MTISEAMVLQRTLKGRVHELQSLRNANAVGRNTYYMLDSGREQKREIVEPKYDPKVVDRKVVEIEAFLFKLDAGIKRANAVTDIGIGADVDKLLEPIE